MPAATAGTGGTPSGPTGAVTGTSTGASGTGLSSTGRPATGSRTSPGTPNSGPAGTGTGTPAAVPVDYRWTALAGSARSVTLPAAGTLDWVYPGARADLKLQRAKRPAAGQAIGLRLPAGAASVAGPLRVTWSDGVPEQDRADDARWLAVPAGGTVTVQLPRSAAARTLRMYVGGPGAPFTLGLAGAAVAATTTTVTGSPAGTGPSLLTVPVPAGTDLTVTLTAPAGPPGLALGPVVLDR